jgi:phosphoglycolate phosphatase
VLFIFDLDGTISDSYPGIERAFRHALTKLEHPEAGRAAYHEFIGAPLPEAFALLLAVPTEETRAAVDYFREYYADAGWKENQLYEGMLPLLLSLREQGHTLAVATNKPTFFAQKILKHFGADHLSMSSLDRSWAMCPLKNQHSFST